MYWFELKEKQPAIWDILKKAKIITEDTVSNIISSILPFQHEWTTYKSGVHHVREEEYDIFSENPKNSGFFSHSVSKRIITCYLGNEQVIEDKNVDSDDFSINSGYDQVVELSPENGVLVYSIKSEHSSNCQYDRSDYDSYIVDEEYLKKKYKHYTIVKDKIYVHNLPKEEENSVLKRAEYIPEINMCIPYPDPKEYKKISVSDLDDIYVEVEWADEGDSLYVYINKEVIAIFTKSEISNYVDINIIKSIINRKAAFVSNFDWYESGEYIYLVEEGYYCKYIYEIKENLPYVIRYNIDIQWWDTKQAEDEEEEIARVKKALEEYPQEVVNEAWWLCDEYDANTEDWRDGFYLPYIYVRRIEIERS